MLLKSRSRPNGSNSPNSGFSNEIFESSTASCNLEAIETSSILSVKEGFGVTTRE